MKDYLDKPCYKKNFNEGQKNWKELFIGKTFLTSNAMIVYLFIITNVLFVMFA